MDELIRIVSNLESNNSSLQRQIDENKADISQHRARLDILAPCGEKVKLARIPVLCFFGYRRASQELKDEHDSFAHGGEVISDLRCIEEEDAGWKGVYKCGFGRLYGIKDTYDPKIRSDRSAIELLDRRGDITALNRHKRRGKATMLRKLNNLIKKWSQWIDQTSGENPLAER